MGVFKPLLPFGGRTVVETCLQNLRAAGAAEIVVVIGHRAEEMRARLGHLSVSFAVNDQAESEMTVSVARGVEQVSGDAEAVLIALADQPAVSSEVIRSLMEARFSSDARLFVPEWNNRGGHPVLIDLCYRPELLHLDPQKGLRALFDAHRGEVLRVPVDSPYIARDMDTWDEYRALHQEIFGDVPPLAPPPRQS
jgi:molybdenum cofactor cytidylyltransferase